MYLKRPFRVWMAYHDIPAELQAVIGRRRFAASLKTEDCATAKARAAVLEGQWRAAVEQARRGQTPEGMAMSYRARFKAATSDAERTAISAEIKAKVAAMIDAASGSADEWLAWPTLAQIASEPAFAEAQKFRGAATGELVPTLERLEEYLGTLKYEAKTIALRRASITKFAEPFPYIADVRRAKVQAWINEQAYAGKSRATIHHGLSALRGYWRYLRAKEDVADDHEPFDKLSVAAGSKLSAGDRRRPFDPADVLKLLVEARKRKDGQLADLIEIAAYTGCRMEEITSLTLEHVKADYLEIADAKTAAGWRQVPVHSKLAPTLARMIGGRTDGYVLEGLNADKFGDRRGTIGKKFSLMKVSLGFGPQYVFHSIRKTVATLLQQSGVPEATAAAILGHEVPTMTFGLYSAGPSLEQKRVAIEKLDYKA